jgi:hypothetical protein
MVFKKLKINYDRAGNKGYCLKTGRRKYKRGTNAIHYSVSIIKCHDRK